MKETINLKPIADLVEISDGYHTFTELYEHRIGLYLAFCRKIKGYYPVWKSFKHSDGTEFDGWFILGINKDAGKQITYHIPVKYWNATVWAETLDEAPEFDGHTSKDVLERLSLLY